MRLLYPCDPFEKKRPDEEYREEYEAAQAAGITCSLFSVEDFESGEFKSRPPLAEGEEVIYRGWMFTPSAYENLQIAIERMGGKVLTSSTQYRHCHYLPEWYSLCEDVTPKTIFFAKGDDFASGLAHTTWGAYFVKDYVKSLTTNRGSIAHSVVEIDEIVSLLEKYRGQIEGGICIREYEDLLPETEERYFVFKGKVSARDGEVPEMVRKIAEKIGSPFFSVDIVLTREGAPRLIELGDGQVSDKKKWPAELFIQVFNG